MKAAVQVMGGEEVRAGVTPSNAGAVRFYTALGFFQVDACVSIVSLLLCLCLVSALWHVLFVYATCLSTPPSRFAHTSTRVCDVLLYTIHFAG